MLFLLRIVYSCMGMVDCGMPTENLNTPNHRLHLTAKPLRGLVRSGLRPSPASEPGR